MQHSVVTMVLGTLLSLYCTAASASKIAVKITPGLEGIAVEDAIGAVQIRRNQDEANEITSNFQRTSRKCPPFCIQSMHLSDGIENIGELEMLGYLQRAGSGRTGHRRYPRKPVGCETNRPTVELSPRQDPGDVL